MYANLYMTCEDHVFVANVVVIDPTQEMVASSVISRAISVVVELNTIVKICKYKRLHEGLHFIMMAMEVHQGMIWIISSRRVLVFSTIDNLEVIRVPNFIYMWNQNPNWDQDFWKKML
jgi:hypothetical protein